jgi:threonine/homoserine efflux transporter RhtA
MKLKSLLFIGVILLTIGILLRKMTQMDDIGLSFIITGVLCKTIYIVTKARNGEYKPGKELIVLALGLLLFLIGLYLRNIKQNLMNPIYFIVLGITLKLIFIVRFIQIIRSEKKR